MCSSDLRCHPVVYAAMVANGVERGAKFSVAATKSRWMRFLTEDVLPDALAWKTAHHSLDSGWLAQLVSLSAQKLATKWFKLRVYREWHAQS